MALAATNASEPRAFSIGPLKLQLMNLSAANGDTSGTITADALSSIEHVQVSGLTMTAAPTFAGNVITLAIADPLADAFGQILIFGK